MLGIIERMFRRFEARQVHFFENLPRSSKEKFAELEDKYAELTVTGPEGGVFYLQYKGGHFHRLGEKPKVDYDELDKLLIDGDMIDYPDGVEVFLDVFDGDLSPRAAKSRGYFRTNTDRIIYDSEEFIQAFEQFLVEMRMVVGRVERKRR